MIKRKIIEETYEYDTEGNLIWKSIITTEEEEKNDQPHYFYDGHEVKLP